VHNPLNFCKEVAETLQFWQIISPYSTRRKLFGQEALCHFVTNLIEYFSKTTRKKDEPTKNSPQQSQASGEGAWGRG
jgi:hypothetical protein